MSDDQMLGIAEQFFPPNMVVQVAENGPPSQIGRLGVVMSTEVYEGSVVCFVLFTESREPSGMSPADLVIVRVDMLIPIGTAALCIDVDAVRAQIAAAMESGQFTQTMEMVG